MGKLRKLNVYLKDQMKFLWKIILGIGLVSVAITAFAVLLGRLSNNQMSTLDSTMLAIRIFAQIFFGGILLAVGIYVTVWIIVKLIEFFKNLKEKRRVKEDKLNSLQKRVDILEEDIGICENSSTRSNESYREFKKIEAYIIELSKKERKD